MCDPQLGLVPMPTATVISWAGSPTIRIVPPLTVPAGGFVAVLTGDGRRQLAAYDPNRRLLEWRDVPAEADHDRVTFTSSVT